MTKSRGVYFRNPYDRVLARSAGGKRVARCHACEVRRSRASKRTGRERVVGAEAAKVLDR